MAAEYIYIYTPDKDHGSVKNRILFFFRDTTKEKLYNEFYEFSKYIRENLSRGCADLEDQG